mgnify:FL=1
MRKILSQILQTILIIAFIYFLFFTKYWKIAAILGLANIIFWLIPDWYNKTLKK